MKSLFTTLVAFVFTASAAMAQQAPYYTNYMFNRLALNPAYAGTKDGIEATLLHHQQWVGYEGNAAPKTQALNVSAPIGNHGIGISLVNDKLGFERMVNALVDYNYKIRFNGQSLAIGLGAGIMQKSLDGSQLKGATGGDQKIPGGNSSSIRPDFSAGLYYNNEDLNQLYVGVSALYLTQQDFDYSSSSNIVQYNSRRHYHLMAGMSFDLTPSLALRPNLLLKYDGTVVQFDANADLLINQRLRAGVSYRTGDAMSILAGYYILPNLHVGYSYDYALTDIRRVSSGTHEIVLNYVLKAHKRAVSPARMQFSPRFM